MKRRQFSKEFKRQVVEEAQSGSTSQAEILRKYEIGSSVYIKWVQAYERGLLDNTPSKEGVYLNRIAELERKVGQMTMEVDLLKKLREQQQKRAKEFSSGRILTGPSKGGAQ